MTRKTGLGKGLGGLFGEETVEEVKHETVSQPKKTPAKPKTAAKPKKNAEKSAPVKQELPPIETVTEVMLSHVEPNPDQPRKVFDEEALAELTESISRHGIITPLTVRESGKKGYYQIIAGERRWRAARQAGLKKVPVYIIEADDLRLMQLALIENLQRMDLNPIEEAEGYEKLMREHNLTQDDVAQQVSKSRPAVANALRLLALPDEVRELVAEGKLSGGHARAVLAVNDPFQRVDAARAMSTLSVRQAEALAKRLNKKPTEKPQKPAFEVDYVAEIEKNLESTLGRKVSIAQGKNSGTISLEYYGNEDLDRLIEALQALRV